jgi:hypothetical protein
MSLFWIILLANSTNPIGSIVHFSHYQYFRHFKTRMSPLGEVDRGLGVVDCGGMGMLGTERASGLEGQRPRRVRGGSVIRARRRMRPFGLLVCLAESVL